MTPVAHDIVDARVRLPLGLRPLTTNAKPPELTDRYDEVLGTHRARDKTIADLVAEMKAVGVAHAVMHAEYEYGDDADELNEITAKTVAEQPGLFSGFGTVSLTRLRPLAASRQVQTVAELGLSGINIQPAFFNIAIDERGLYPIYARAAELNLAIAIHTSVNYSTSSPMTLEHPMMIDRIACDFPGLRIIACHGGWPWVTQMVAVMRRHRDVYSDFGGWAPRYIGEPATGWEVMRRQMENTVSKQVLFATDWPVFPHDRAVREWQQMGLSRESLDRLFATNARALLMGRDGR